MDKRILHIITGLGTGGAEMLLYSLSSRTNCEHSQLMIVSLTDGGSLRDRIESLGIPVKSLGMSRSVFSILALFRLFRIVREFKPDIVQGWMYHANLFAMFAAKICRQKTMLIWGIFHSIEKLSTKKMSLRIVVKVGAFLSKWVDVIVNNSSKSVFLHERIGYSESRTVVIPNGIDTQLFHSDSDGYAGIRRELEILDNSLLVGLVGRFDPLKDHSNFLRACSIVNRWRNDIKFLLIGHGVDETNTQLRDQIDSLRLAGNVFLLGERNDIPRLLASLDVSVSSSISEGMPVAISESMSCEVPCVVTDVGDSSDLVGDCGFVVPPSDSEALGEAIINLLRKNKSDRAALGRCSRLRIKNNFSVELFVSKFETIYNSSF